MITRMYNWQRAGIMLSWRMSRGSGAGSNGCRESGETDAEERVMAIGLRPLDDRVVVRPLAREEVTKSGIVLPDTAKEKPQEGMVVAIGPGALNDEGKRNPMDVKVGEKVLFAKYAGTEFKLDDVEYLIVGQKDILAIVAD
jgi:chaperonin GroES